MGRERKIQKKNVTDFDSFESLNCCKCNYSANCSAGCWMLVCWSWDWCGASSSATTAAAVAGGLLLLQYKLCMTECSIL